MSTERPRKRRNCSLNNGGGHGDDNGQPSEKKTKDDLESKDAVARVGRTLRSSSTAAGSKGKDDSIKKADTDKKQSLTEDKKGKQKGTKKYSKLAKSVESATLVAVAGTSNEVASTNTKTRKLPKNSKSAPNSGPHEKATGSKPKGKQKANKNSEDLTGIDCKATKGKQKASKNSKGSKDTCESKTKTALSNAEDLTDTDSKATKEKQKTSKNSKVSKDKDCESKTKTTLSNTEDLAGTDSKATKGKTSKNSRAKQSKSSSQGKADTVPSETVSKSEDNTQKSVCKDSKNENSDGTLCQCYCDSPCRNYCSKLLQGNGRLVYNFPSKKSDNLMYALQRGSLGIKRYQENNEVMSDILCSSIKTMKLLRTGSPFDRRVTALEWHPYKPNILAAGSKGGDMILWDIDAVKNERFIKGIGPGGSIQAMKFWPDDYSHIVTASIDGTVTRQSFDGGFKENILNTWCCSVHWYTSLGVCDKKRLLCGGSSGGMCGLVALNGTKIWNKKLHKAKITHVEFNHSVDWMLCTASNDRTVKIWDMRMLKHDEKYVPTPLVTLQHNRAVNSAYFSLTDGQRLLTTDQLNEVNVYKAPNWHLERSFPHPHRFYQHLTPIKAQWHPYKDVFVVGRYPDNKSPLYKSTERRTIDIYSLAHSKINPEGMIEPNCLIYDPHTTGIISLNQFNRLGNVLASGMGFNILVWKNNEELHETQTKIMNEMIKSGLTPHAAYARTAVSTSRAARLGTDTQTEVNYLNKHSPVKNFQLMMTNGVVPPPRNIETGESSSSTSTSSSNRQRKTTKKTATKKDSKKKDKKP